MRLFSWDIYIEFWDQKEPWRLKNWIFGHEKSKKGDIMVWFGPWHLALSPIIAK